MPVMKEARPEKGSKSDERMYLLLSHNQENFTTKIKQAPPYVLE